MARRQEQEAARSEVEEVAAGVLRMQLPIRMPGLGHVNCYALLDRDGAALVDPGLPGPATVEAFSHRLFAPRSWGAMAESETYAHLEHLRLLGEADRHEGRNGLLIYATG